MACSICGLSTTCNPASPTLDSACQCVPAAAGAAYCDPRFANLPAVNKLNLIGASGECLATFPKGVCGLIFWDELGFASITSAPAQDLPSLITYLLDSGQADGMARQDGKLIEGIPPTFDYMMVMETPCNTNSCCDTPQWKKWRGPANTTGYVFWNGVSFEFGGINAAGVVTSAILTKLGEGYIGAFPSSIDPTISGDKTLGYLCPTFADIYSIGVDCIAKPINPGNVKGFVYYGEASTCDASIVPQVAQLCSIANPPCIDKPVPVQLVGCASDGVPASTLPTGALATGFCNKIPVNAGGGAEWMNGAIGGTFFPGNEGTLYVALGANGSNSQTVSAASIAAASGYILPTNITHILVHVRAVLRKSTSERSRLTVTVAGIGVVECSAYSWDGVNNGEDIQTATAVVPVSVNGSVAVDVNHSAVADSTHDVTVNLSGVFACAELE